MHYEDLILKELKNSGENWIAKFDSVRGGSFNFLIADSKVTDEELIELGIIIGKSFLGAIENDKLVALDGFSYINSKSKSR